MKCIEVVGFVSSIATLILFVIYFVGRLIAIFRYRDLFEDEILFLNNDEDFKNYNVIQNFQLVPECNTFVIVRSKSGIYSLKINRLKKKNDFDIVGRKTVEKIKFLNVGESIAIEVPIPEIFCEYEIEYITPDYRKVIYPIKDNLKSGVNSEFIRPKHTLKSILFFLFR